MFQTMTENMTQFCQNFPIMGATKEYQEKLQNLQKSWFNFVNSTSSYAALSFPLWQNFSKEFPKYVEESYNKNFSFEDMSKTLSPEEITKNIKKHMSFLDKCWENVVNSEEYVKTNAQCVENMASLKKSLEEFNEIFLTESPLASRQQIKELSEQIETLRKKFEELQAK